jgi:hypothetical protein
VRLRRARATYFRPAAAGQSHRARRRATCESQFPAGERAALAIKQVRDVEAQQSRAARQPRCRARMSDAST